MPFGVETVFPVGPLQYCDQSRDKKIEGASISLRFSIINHNNTAIPTTPFVDPAYAGVSAVFGCATDRRYGKPLSMHVVHNPFSAVPVSHGLFGVAETNGSRRRLQMPRVNLILATPSARHPTTG